MSKLINTVNNFSSLSDAAPIYADLCVSCISSEDVKEEDVKDDLELLKIVKDYLALCLQKVLDDPDEIIKESIKKEQEEEIKSLRQEVMLLSDKVRSLQDFIGKLIPMLPPTSTPYYDYPYILNNSPYTFNPNAPIT